jgi:AraC-like DNA-binding protein
VEKAADQRPGCLDRIAEIIGEALTLRVVEEFGGQALYVAQNPTDTQRLAKVIGLDAAQRLAREFGSGVVVVPICRSWRIRKQVLDLIGQGLSADEIARRVGCHQRTVARYRRKRRAMRSGSAA